MSMDGKTDFSPANKFTNLCGCPGSLLVPTPAAIMHFHARTTEIWTAVAERSGDTAFHTTGCVQKRRGSRSGGIPAAKNPWFGASRVGFIRG